MLAVFNLDQVKIKSLNIRIMNLCFLMLLVWAENQEMEIWEKVANQTYLWCGVQVAW